MGGRHEYSKVLPGTLKGSLMTLAHFHPNALQPLALYLMPWLNVDHCQTPGLAFGGDDNDNTDTAACIVCKEYS
jgi:hypothetical protein